MLEGGRSVPLFVVGLSEPLRNKRTTGRHKAVDDVEHLEPVLDTDVGDVAEGHKHSVNNPYSQFQDEYSRGADRAAPMLWEPLTKLQC